MRRFFAVGSLLFTVFLLGGCSAFDLVNALVPDEGYRVERNLAYGDGPRENLDLYVPDGATSATPTIVFFYGGNWQTGSKEDYGFAAQAFTSRGYAVAIPDYRLYPEVRFPGFLKDAARAVAWVHDNVARLGLAPGPVYLVGHSAGAYIAAMLTLQESWLRGDGKRVCDTVAATATLAGPFDFLPLESETLKVIFGPAAQRARTQPINHADGTAPPMLLAAGLDDATVRPGNSRRLAARIRQKGGKVEERYYEGLGHVALVAALARPLRGLAPVLDDVDAFLRRQGRPANSCPDPSSTVRRPSPAPAG